jgi:hypothetical protein
MKIEGVAMEIQTRAMELPSLRQVLSKALKALEPPREGSEDAPPLPPADSNVPVRSIGSLPEQIQSAFIALDKIYPSTLLLSLDILDRGLATRYILPKEERTSEHFTRIYYVRSLQPRSSRFAIPPIPKTAYEVRPDAWHCTCASFAFKAFSSEHAFDPNECGVEDCPGSDRWGGELRGTYIPVCKHLLAVLIGERMNLIPEREVDVNTLANYAHADAY